MTVRYHDRVEYELDGRVAIITLDRADKLNAFDGAMYEGMNEALMRFRDDAEAWVAVIQAAGDRAFSAGADVDALNENTAKGIHTGLGELVTDSDMVTAKPIIAAVHGACVGEGVNLLLACDLVLADEDARFIISEARIGINAVDIPIKLGKKIGYSKAFAFMTPGTAKSAAWCQAAGFVEEVTPSGQVQARARQLAREIASDCGPLAVQAQKETLWGSVFGDEAAAHQAGAARKLELRQSFDYQEGRSAFKERRKAQFRAE